MEFVSVLRSINLMHPSLDLAVLIVFAAAVWLFIFRWGKGRLIITLLSIYAALALMAKFPIVQKATGVALPSGSQGKIAVYLLLVAAVYLIINRSDYASVFNRSARNAWFQLLVMSFLTTGLLISTAISFLTLEEAKELSIFLKAFFVDIDMQAFWLVSPLLATFLIKEK